METEESPIMVNLDRANSTLELVRTCLYDVPFGVVGSYSRSTLSGDGGDPFNEDSDIDIAVKLNAVPEVVRRFEAIAKSQGLSFSAQQTFDYNGPGDPPYPIPKPKLIRLFNENSDIDIVVTPGAVPEAVRRLEAIARSQGLSFSAQQTFDYTCPNGPPDPLPKPLPIPKPIKEIDEQKVTIGYLVPIHVIGSLTEQQLNSYRLVDGLRILATKPRLY